MLKKRVRKDRKQNDHVEKVLLVMTHYKDKRRISIRGILRVLALKVKVVDEDRRTDNKCCPRVS